MNIYGDNGRWQQSSVQSNMPRVEGYVLLNISGIYSLICSRVGQLGIEPGERYDKFVQVIIYLETVAFGV